MSRHIWKMTGQALTGVCFNLALSKMLLSNSLSAVSIFPDETPPEVHSRWLGRHLFSFTSKRPFFLFFSNFKHHVSLWKGLSNSLSFSLSFHRFCDSHAPKASSRTPLWRNPPLRTYEALSSKGWGSGMQMRSVTRGEKWISWFRRCPRRVVSCCIVFGLSRFFTGNETGSPLFETRQKVRINDRTRISRKTV